MGSGKGWLEVGARETGRSQGQTSAWSSPPQALCSDGLQAPECDGAPGPTQVGKLILVTSSQGAYKVNIHRQQER